MKLIAILALSYCLWACNPVDVVSPPPDCPDTNWVMTKDGIYSVISHRPCKQTWDVDLGQYVPALW